MEAGHPGLLATTKGKPSNQRYKHCALWIDHYSCFIHPQFQEAKGNKETLCGKALLEQFAAKCDVKIEHIHADNGIFASADFIAACVENTQTNSFCGVGAHWQKGIAERCIGAITSMARAFLLHAQSSWSDVIKTKLWPFCVCQAINFHDVCRRRGWEHCPWMLFTDETPPLSDAKF